MPDDKPPPVFVPIVLEMGRIVEPAPAVEPPPPDESPSDSVISARIAEQTRSVLATLTPREEEVLRKRFGIGEKVESMDEEVGRDFEITRQRIREIEAKALRKLRERKEAREGEATTDDADEIDDDDDE